MVHIWNFLWSLSFSSRFSYYLCFYHQLWAKWVCILEIVRDIFELIHDSQNTCGHLSLNETNIKFTSLIICSVNNNLTNRSSTPPPEGKKVTVYDTFYVPQQKLLFIGNLRIKSLTWFKHQINIAIVLLSCGSFLKNWSKFWVNGVFKCNKLAVHFKLVLDRIFVVLYKCLNCAAMIKL